MLTSEDVFKNTVLPSRIIGAGVNSLNSVHRTSGHTHHTSQTNGISEIEADMGSEMMLKPLQLKGGWVSRGISDVGVNNISSLQSDSVTEINRHHHQQHRSQRPEKWPLRTVSDISQGRRVGPHRENSFQEFRNDVHHAATETYLITQLALTLLRYLGIGTRWMSKLVRLYLYALFLMPGFIQVGFNYYFSRYIHRSIVYGDEPRNRLDLYIPPRCDDDTPKPVVIFVTGGAWIIGYKAWAALLGQQLADHNIIVACLDYRNFPQGSISDMVADVTAGIGYVCQNITNFGGDPNRVFLAGQSAGAHLAACALVKQAQKEGSEDPTKLLWSSCKLKAFLAISGGYNLTKLVDHFHKQGLYRSIFLSVMEGEESLPLFSPELLVLSPSFRKAVPLLPPISLFHGTADYSILYDASVAFGNTLQSVGAKVTTTLYARKTHTDLFLQDPMRGGADELLADILAVVHEGDEEAKAEDIMLMKTRRRLVPEFLLQLAHTVSPF
jgi:prenylcysteine alpha-carboxyl methylesterase